VGGTDRINFHDSPDASFDADRRVFTDLATLGRHVLSEALSRTRRDLAAAVGGEQADAGAAGEDQA